MKNQDEIFDDEVTVIGGSEWNPGTEDPEYVHVGKKSHQERWKTTAIVLGIGRAIGEAMAIMMVAGNVANMPSIFKSVRFLTTAVASEMSYSSGLQREALFSIALVLFLFIMLINAVLNMLKTGGKNK